SPPRVRRCYECLTPSPARRGKAGMGHGRAAAVGGGPGVPPCQPPPAMRGEGPDAAARWVTRPPGRRGRGGGGWASRDRGGGPGVPPSQPPPAVRGEGPGAAVIRRLPRAAGEGREGAG